MTYEDVDLWTRVFNTFVNRVSIVNQVLGSRYEGLAENPCKLTYSRGLYTCELCGCIFCEFRVYDSDGLDAAYHAIDSLASGLWYLVRSGRLSFT